MQKKQKILIILFIICSHSFLFAEMNFDSLLSHLPQGAKNTLRSQEALTSITTHRDKDRLLYTPNINLYRELETFLVEQKPQIFYESLFFLQETDEERKQELYLIIANHLLDVPVLATIEYQNLKDGNIHPLFESSYAITSPSNETRVLSLPQLVQYPSSHTDTKIYVKQDMPPFGEVKSEYIYSYNTDYFEFTGTNLTPIAYKGIKAVKERNMYTACWVFNTDQGILVYGVGTVRMSGVASILRGVVSNSFTSRMVGLFKWLNRQITLGS